jgi:hypothetical protein
VWKTSQGKPCSDPVLALYRIAVLYPQLFSPIFLSLSSEKFVPKYLKKKS